MPKGKGYSKKKPAKKMAGYGKPLLKGQKRLQKKRKRNAKA